MSALGLTILVSLAAAITVGVGVFRLVRGDFPRLPVIAAIAWVALFVSLVIGVGHDPTDSGRMRLSPDSIPRDDEALGTDGVDSVDAALNEIETNARRDREKIAGVEAELSAAKAARDEIELASGRIITDPTGSERHPMGCFWEVVRDGKDAEGKWFVVKRIDCTAALRDADEKIVTLQTHLDSLRSAADERLATKALLEPAALEIFNGRVANADNTPPPRCRTCGYAGWASVEYAGPDTMRYKTPAEVGLALVPAETEASAGSQPGAKIVLNPDRYGGEVKTRDAPARYALAMRAQLSAPEIDFKIEPFDREVRNVTSYTEPMAWSWFVTPQRPGSDKRLSIRFQALLIENGQEQPFGLREETFTVAVDVTPWERLGYMASEITKVQAVIASFGAGGLVVLGWITGLFRKKKPKEPLQVEVRFQDPPTA